MPTYTATFHASHVFASEDIKARTPRQALKRAHALYGDDGSGLDWWPYDPSYKPLDQIEIESPTGEEKGWQSEDVALRLAAQELLDALEAQTGAAQAVIDAWDMGDLAGAVHALEGFIPAARTAIAAAKGGAQ